MYNVDQRKSETSGSWLQATKPEIRNPKPTAKVDFKRRNPKAETRDPKSETDSESGFQATKLETRNSKAETGSESWLQATKPEPRNPKPVSSDDNPKPDAVVPEVALAEVAKRTPALPRIEVPRAATQQFPNFII